MTSAAIDPREYGTGLGDVVDVVVRGRVTHIGPLSVVVDGVAPDGLAAYIPAELIVSVSLIEDENGATA